MAMGYLIPQSFIFNPTE
uniref:Uncharacterized protein n=1 Tax=Rhizophora mucronata TaxID=61149 RepID=A0A2P2PYK4_RHIMU